MNAKPTAGPFVLRWRSLAGVGGGPFPTASTAIPFGVPALDGPLGGGIARAALHEAYPAGAPHAAAATGFVAALAWRAAGGGRPIAWVRQDFLDTETGLLHPSGLAEIGLDPGRVLLVRARDVRDVLRAGAEAARCAVLGAVVIEPWGESPLLDLTASRRLSLAAAASGVAVLTLRVGASPAPSAAATRWLVRSAPSRALAADAPGPPNFAVTLLRHRGGAAAGRAWCLEWDRDRGCFRNGGAVAAPDAHATPVAAPVSRLLVSLPARRAVAAAARAAGVGQARAG